MRRIEKPWRRRKETGKGGKKGKKWRNLRIKGRKRKRKEKRRRKEELRRPKGMERRNRKDWRVLKWKDMEG